MAGERIERPRVLFAAGIDRADVSLLAAGTEGAGRGGIHRGRAIVLREKVPAIFCAADGAARRNGLGRSPLSVGARGVLVVL